MEKIIYDKEECLNYIKNAFAGNINLDLISEELKDDPDIIVQAIKKNQNLINPLSENLMKWNSSVLSEVFDITGSELFRRMSPELVKNPDFMLKAVEAFPDTIYHLPANLKNDLSFQNQCENALTDVAKMYEKKILNIVSMF